jgi:hypothetical protein
MLFATLLHILANSYKHLLQQVGTLEDYDFSKPERCRPGAHTSRSRLRIEREGLCHGFGMFVALAAPQPALAARWPQSKLHATWCHNDLWISSNASDGRCVQYVYI